MRVQQYRISPSGTVIDLDAQRILGRAEPFTYEGVECWIPADAQGNGIAGPSQVRDLAALAVIRHACPGRIVNLLDIIAT